MSDKVDLKLDWCSYEAAKFAVEHWHYSGVLPAGKLVKIGVWEESKYIGCVIFGRGANNNIGNPYGLTQLNVCELVRIALTTHKTPVSKIAAFAIKMLKKQSPDLRLIVSYADPEQGHNGSVYQAMNWAYVGKSQAQREYLIDGEIVHKRSVSSKYGARGLEKLKQAGINADYAHVQYKYKYLFPLDDAMRKQIEPLRKPYPKRERGETDNAPQSNAETEGASPIRSLLSNEAKHGTP